MVLIIEEMEEVEGALPVEVKLTGKAGVFLISEPKETTSSSAQTRLKFEYDLSKAIRMQEWDAFVENQDSPNPQFFSIGNLVAVNVVNISKWHRGQIRNKLHQSSGPVLVILLVDWGETVEVKPKDVLPLPENFKSHPFYARYAILGGIEPLTSSVDYNSSVLVLKPTVSREYDQSAKLFMENKITTSSHCRVVVIGMDNDYMLHIRLFLKQPNEPSFSCLNDQLCSRSYAQVCDPLSRCNLIEFEGELLWESLPIVPMQATLRNFSSVGELFNCYAVGFSDYVKTYETQKDEKVRAQSAQSLSCESETGDDEMLSAESSLSYDLPENREIRSTLANNAPSSSPNGFIDSSTPSTQMMGRGRLLLAMRERINSVVAQKSNPESQSPLPEITSSNGTPRYTPPIAGVPSTSNGFNSSPTPAMLGRGRHLLQQAMKDQLIAKRFPQNGAGSGSPLDSSMSQSIDEVTEEQKAIARRELEALIKMKPCLGADAAQQNGSSRSSSPASSAVSQLRSVVEESVSIGRGAIRSPMPSNEQPVGRNCWPYLDSSQPIVSQDLSSSISPELTKGSKITIMAAGSEHSSNSPVFGKSKSNSPAFGQPRSNSNSPAFGQQRSNPNSPAFGQQRSNSNSPGFGQQRTSSPAIEQIQSNGTIPVQRETGARPRLAAVFNQNSTMKLISPPEITSTEKEEKVNDVQSSKMETHPTTSKARLIIEKLRNSPNSPLLSPSTVVVPKVEENKSKEATIQPQNKPADLRSLIRNALEAKAKSESSKDDSFQTTFSRPPSGFDEPDEDMRELLELATAGLKPKQQLGSSTQREKIEDQVPMLQRSKFLDLIEEGRVLVRSAIPHKPTHVLTAIPFEASIIDRLRHLHISKPKIIQAYIWEAILKGHNVAYVTGAGSGKTLGYMVPILSNLLDKSSYEDVPKGCSPLFIVIVPNYTRAQIVHENWCRLMKFSSDFTADVITDGTPKFIRANLNRLINGVTLLTATAPALASLLQEADKTISFDRCAHLVLDSADMLFSNHMESMKILIPLYQASVKRINAAAANKNHFVPRQIVAFSSEWNKTMDWITSKFMDNPALFISSFMEAAFYGRMKLEVKLVPSAEVNGALLDVVMRNRYTRTIIFCRSANEVLHVEEMLSQSDINPLVAHNHSVISDLNSLTNRWENAAPGSAILICTDDVLIRLNIRNAQTLIHYYIPEQSKYDFSYRLSFSMEKFVSDIPESERAVSYLFLSEESRKPLLTLVKFMERFGDKTVSEALKNEAILSFGEKEYQKKDLPLCLSLKAFGFCRSLSMCKSRHVVIGKYDRPTVPRSGVIRIRISDVRDTTRYYARILKYWDEDKKLVDLSGTAFEIAEKFKKYYKSDMDPIDGKRLKVGELYGRCYGELLQRVRLESIVTKDYMDCPTEVEVNCIDQGSTTNCFVPELFELSDELKTYPPQAVEIFLVGLKPLEKNTSWSPFSNGVIREKLMGHELEGNIMLALSSTLWLQPLQERTRPPGSRACVVVVDVAREILDQHLGEKNPDHMMLLHHLCETGGLMLPDSTLGVAKKNRETVDASYAFLPMKEESLVQVSYTSSPFRFYVCQVKFQEMLEKLERDISHKLSKCRKMTYEEAHPGMVCLVEIADGGYIRGCIQKRTATKEAWTYRVFLVDYGDCLTCSLDQLRTLPNEFLNRLPFQAIACSLDGVKPSQQEWTSEAVDFFVSLTRDDQNVLRQLSAKPTMKHSTADELTKGPHYLITLTQADGDTRLDLSEEIVSSQHGLPVAKAEDVNQLVEQSDELNNEALKAQEALKTKELEEAGLRALMEEESNMDMSPEWYDAFIGQLRTSPSPETTLHKVIEEEFQSAKSILSNQLPPSPSPEDFVHVTIEEEEGFQSANSILSLPQTTTEKKNSTLTLLDHAEPLKADTSFFPPAKWMQNKSDVIINFTIEGISNYQLNVTEDHLVFVADVNGKRFELKTYLFDFIIPDESAHSRIPSGVKVVLRKQKKGGGHIWRRLLRTPIKQHSWLGRDFSLWPNDTDDDYDDYQEKICDPRRSENMDPEYAFKDMQTSDEESIESVTDLDDECGLDKTLEDEED